MKNKFIKYSKVILVLLLLSACNDDYLERYPLDQISSETFWNTATDLQNYNNSLYDKIKNDDLYPIMLGHGNGSNWNQGIWWQDMMSDNLAPINGRSEEFFNIKVGKHLVPNAAPTASYKGFDLIRAINFGLENYGRAKITDVEKNKYIGEARLFRGWFYAEKVEKFGDVQWIDKVLNIDSEELYGERTPREKVMENVLADLNFACANLPADWGDGNAPGRLNRWCALLVKSRLCLFEGTFRKYHGVKDADMWIQEAAASAKELMDKGPYKLHNTGDPLNDYKFIHGQISLSGNKEVLYWRKYTSGILNNWAQRYFINYVGGATKSFVEDALCTDGLPISLSPMYKGDAQIEDVFINRDPRLRQCVLHPADKEKYRFENDALNKRVYPRLEGSTLPYGGITSTTGYHVIKQYNALDLEGKAFGTSESSAITLRFAEALLNYAEAQAELGKLTQSDLDVSINLLRKRAGMPNMVIGGIPVDPRYVTDGVSPLIVEIRRERRIELFIEGFRYLDLLRWKQGKKLEKPDLGILWDAKAKARYSSPTRIKSSIDPVSGKEYIDVYKGTVYENPVFNESKHYLWPIPISVISQNPKIGQNPGWN